MFIIDIYYKIWYIKNVVDVDGKSKIKFKVKKIISLVFFFYWKRK